MLEAKAPPHNEDAEKAVLGGLLLDTEAWDQIADILDGSEFYVKAHQKIFAAIRQLQEKSQPIDIITVTNHLTSTKDIDLVGGAAYLAELINQTISSVHIATYAKIVREKNILRRFISTTSRLIERSYSQDFDDVDSFLDEAEGQIYQVANQKDVSGLVGSSEIIKSSLEKIEELYAVKADITGISSGFYDLDQMTAGLQPGEMTIIAARPSMGKTAFSLNIAQHVAIREKKTVAYFSVEMAKEAVMMRVLASEAKVNIGELRTGHISDSHWPRLINAAASISDANLFIDDSSGISPFEIRAKARRLKAQHGLDLIMIDYLQIMALKQRVDSREREVSEISRLLKAIAKELSVPVIALAQLNRGVEGRTDRRPLLSDLRESGSIEQDADVIMMIYREDYYERNTAEHRGLAEIIIGKQRNGPTGTVKLTWRPQWGIFENWSEDEDIPPPGPGEPNSAPLPPGRNEKPKNYAPGAP